MRIRRNAFAIAGLIPRISNSTFSASSLVTSTPKDSRKDSIENVLSTPTAAYAPEKAYSLTCLFSSAPHVTNWRWRSSSALTEAMSGLADASFFFEPAMGAFAGFAGSAKSNRRLRACRTAAGFAANDAASPRVGDAASAAGTTETAESSRWASA